MNFNHFKYIIQIAELGSISKAAESLYISQPYLSRMIKEIETEMEIKIFERSVEGMTLTSDGRQFLNQSKLILEQYQSLLDIKSKTNQQPKNSIIVSTVRSSFVMEAFMSLIDKYYDSNYEFTLNENNGDVPIQDITYLKADLGVIYVHHQNRAQTIENLNKNDIIYKKICDFEHCIVLGIDHPLANEKSLTFEALKHYGFVTYPNDHLPYQKQENINDLLDTVLKQKLFNKIIKVNSRASLHNILNHTHCFSIGTQSAKNQEENFKITSIPLEGYQGTPSIEMGVIYRKTTKLHDVANQFVHILQKHYQ